MYNNVLLTSLLIICSLLFYTQKANALGCALSDGTITETVELESLVFLSGTSDGDVIWYSPTYSRDITCTTGYTENVFIYPYPKRSSETLPSGVAMGLIFNGVDLGTFNTNTSSKDSRQDTGWTITANQPGTEKMTFQAYMVKDGDIDTTSVTNGITLFQLDGNGGLNSTPNSNYNLYITNWENTGTLDCTNSLSNTSFSVAAIDTDEAYAGTVSFNVSAPVINFTCSSSSSSILNAATSVVGNLKLSGTAASGNSLLFSTDKENLGLSVNYNNSILSPEKVTVISIPISSGKGSKALSLDIQPRLLSLVLNNPSWLFNADENTVTSDIDFSFTPTSVNTD